MSLIKFVPVGVQAQMGVGAYFGESIGFGMHDQWMKKINQFKVDASFVSYRNICGNAFILASDICVISWNCIIPLIIPFHWVSKPFDIDLEKEYSTGQKRP